MSEAGQCQRRPSSWRRGWPRVPARRFRRAVAAVVQRLVVDVVGLCVAARREDYVDATLAAVDRGGPCTAIGHAGGFDAFGAALVNGTAAHGEDFDDTFEGGPVHAGRGRGAGGARGVRARGPVGPARGGWHRRGRRADVPPEPGGADGRAQGGLSPHRGLRRAGRGWRRRRRAWACGPRRWCRRSGSPAAWRRASSSTWPKARGPSACTPAGRRNPAFAPR